MRKDSPKERRRALATELLANGLDGALIAHPKHILYFSGFASNLNPWQTAMKGPRTTSFLLVDAGGQAHLLVGKSEVANAFTGAGLIDTKSVGDVATYQDYKLDERMLTYGDVLSRELESWLGSLRSGDLTLDSLGTEGWFLPDIYARAIASARCKKTLDISEIVMRMRRTKGIDELQNLREAVRLTDLAYKIGREKLRDGISEIELFRSIESGLADRLPPYGSVIGDYISGERTLNVDGGPTERRVKRGDTFILDLHICQNQYWSDLCRTFVLGRPSTAQQRVLEALVSAKEVGEAVLAAGARCGDIFEAVSNELARAGYPRLPHHAGHGLGLDAQEPPWFLPGSDDVLEEGMVCVLEPGIYSTAGGVRIEDCYILGKGGPEKISRSPIRF